MFRYQWTQQPQYPAQINWSNPISRNLTNSVDICGYDICANKALSRYNGSYATKLLKSDTAFSFDATGLLSTSVPKVTTGLTYYKTIFCNIMPTLGSTGVAVALSRPSGYDQLGVYFSGGMIYAFLRDSPGTVRSITDSVSTRSDVVTACCVTFIHRPSTLTKELKLFLDGIEVASSTWTSGELELSQLTIGASVYSFGALPGGSLRFTGKVNSVLVWGRVLNAAEIRSVSANPWQIFQP